MTRTLGIDAGGSSIRSLLVDDATGAHLGEATYPGRNLVFNDDTIDVLTTIVAENAAERCGIAVAGGGNRVAAHELGKSILQRVGVPTVVVGDYVAAHYACFGSGSGAVIIAGTGSVCYARNAAGDRTLLGGFGPVLGDEGSAWWIGRRAVVAALRAREQLGEPTALLGAIDQRMSGGLMSFLSAGTGLFTDRARLARVAPIVDELVCEDEVARQIMTDAGEELAGLAEAAVRQLGSLPIGLVGGVFASAIVTATITAAVGVTNTGRRPVEAASELAKLGQEAADGLGYLPAR